MYPLITLMIGVRDHGMGGGTYIAHARQKPTPRTPHGECSYTGVLSGVKIYEWSLR